MMTGTAKRLSGFVEAHLFQIGCSITLIAYLTLVTASRSVNNFCAVPLGFLNLLLLAPEDLYGYSLPLTALTGFAIGSLISKLWQRANFAGLLILGMAFVFNALAFFTWCMMNIRW